MSISLDELSRLVAEDRERERAEREAEREALVDPFKRKRTEPGRARPNHGSLRPSKPSVSLGGRHS